MQMNIFNLLIVGTLLLGITTDMSASESQQTPRKQTETVTDVSSFLPRAVTTGKQGKFHVQGVVVDARRGYAYFSFTTRLVKIDLHGNLIGSVEGLTGHLGDLACNPENGQIYGSLEYKNDGIGKGIRKGLGEEETVRQRDGFYVAIFDPDKITRPGMDAEKDGVMTTVYLKTVTDDYYAKVSLPDGRTVDHRYGCSGIDGITFAPSREDGKANRLYVAYGIYSDTTRTDNDYQVLLSYDVADWQRYARPLSQQAPHTSGPDTPENRYFVYTGNTTYGIQNLAYDAASGNFYAAVYKGSKQEFPNYLLFVIDGKAKPKRKTLKGFPAGEKGWVLPLAEAGLSDSESGVRGWNFRWGATGLCPLGDGLFYISHNGTTPNDKQQYSELHLYRWKGEKDEAFVPVH